MIVPYFKQEKKYTCSLASLRMVLAYYGKNVTEEKLVNQVKKDYRSNFKNLWNPTIAKLACQYGIITKMYAAWPLFKKNIFPIALEKYLRFGNKMNVHKYENNKDKDLLTEPLPLAYKEMFEAVKLGCQVSYGKLTLDKVCSALKKNHLIQTSIKLHIMYPGKKHIFHSIVVFGINKDKVLYHDPAHGANLSCSVNRFVKATNDVGAAIIYKEKRPDLC